MGVYNVEVVQTRTAVLEVEAPTEEWARVYVRDEFPYADEWDEWEDGYNVFINGVERVDEYGTD